MGLTLACSPRARVRAGLIFGLSLLCVFGTLASGNPPLQERQTSVMLDVVDAPLAQVVRMLTQQSGVNIIITADAGLSNKKVTAHVDGLPLEKVLDYIVTSAGVGYRKTDDGTYLIGAPDIGDAVEVAPVLADTAPKEQPATGSAYQPPKTKVFTEVIKLVCSAPGDILMALGVVPGRVNSPITTGNMDDIYPWKPSTPNRSIVHPAQGVYLQPQTGSVEPVPPTMDTRGSNYGEARRSPNELAGAQQYTPTPTMTRPGYPAGAPGAAPAAPTTPTTAGGLLPPGVEFIMAYDIDNSLIVRGTPEALAELKDLISRYLDIPPKQVSIKAEFIEVSASDVDKLGIDWQIDRLNETFSTELNPSGNVVIGFKTGNVTAELRAELTSGKGRVVNSPIVSTLNNTPASISIGTYIPFFQSVIQNVGQGQLVTTTQLTQLPVQTYLFVLPRVNGDGSITLYLEPSLQDTGRIYKGPSGEEFPETRNQTLRTNRRVMNGETIVVGGFIRRTDSTSTSKVPLLGDLPLIGGLFRSTSTTEEERELLIFLTPTIIPEKGGTTLGVIS